MQQLLHSHPKGTAFQAREGLQDMLRPAAVCAGQRNAGECRQEEDG